MSIPQKEIKVNLSEKLSRQFYARDTHFVARELLGKRLVRILEGARLSGSITEVEAYVGEDDRASHASPGPTARNAPMYGPPGFTYVYLIYGVHNCLNIVTERDGFPAAILIRAIEPLEGLTDHRSTSRATTTSVQSHTRPRTGLPSPRYRPQPEQPTTYAPTDTPLWLEDAPPIPNARIARSPRIGVRGDRRPSKHAGATTSAKPVGQRHKILQQSLLNRSTSGEIAPR